MIAGYYRGWVDTIVARATDVLLALPFLILAVGLAAILGPSLKNAVIALGIGAVPGLIRVARGESLALREEDLRRALLLEQRHQPFDPRIVLERIADVRAIPALFGRTLILRLLCHELPRDARQEREIVVRTDRRRTELPLGKAGHRRPGVPKHHAPDAVLIEQRAQEPVARGGLLGARASRPQPR